MKSPSQFDGKPIGTPMDAKSPFHAGVTMGPDQVERLEALRRARNRALKAESKARHRANVAAAAALPPEVREREWKEHKRRRNTADQMTRALRNGTMVKAVADYYGLTPDEVLSEVKWLAEHRNRHRARHRTGAKHQRGLPQRSEPMSKAKRRKLRMKAAKARNQRNVAGGGVGASDGVQAARSE